MWSRDRREWQPSVGVSRAVWPSASRHRIATSKDAQRQRSLIVSGRREIWRTALPPKPTPPLRLRFIVVLVLILGSLLVAIYFWHLEYILLLLSLLLVFSVFLSVVIVRIQLNKLLHAQRLISLYTPPRRKKSSMSLTPSTHHPYTPETPLPQASLVRVLETIDLSEET